MKSGWRMMGRGHGLAVLALCLGLMGSVQAYAQIELTPQKSLTTAIKDQDTEAVRRILLSREESPNKADSDGDPALVIAAKVGSTELVRMLLNAGANPDSQTDSGATALFWAAAHGHARIAEQLIDQGADLDRQDFQGFTPLIMASRNGFDQVVELLILEGADPNLRDLTGRSPLGWALRSNRRGAALQLRLAGAGE